jgi:glycosyltransferase involved in cell wall biosynthesis
VAAVRIAVVAPPWFEVPPQGYGGIERLCFDLVEGLVDRGHEVTLVATGPRHCRASFLQAMPEPPYGLGEAEGPAQEVRYAAIVSSLLRDLPVDVVHDHSLACPLSWRDRPAPTLVTIHGPTDGAVGDYFRQLRLPAVAISEAQRSLAPDLPWIATIHNSIDVNSYPFRNEKDDYVLFVGRLSPEKGAHVAVDAAREAAVPLVLAGKCKETDERRYFEAEVAPRLHDGATWVGEVSGRRRMDMFARARALLFPAMWDEPFGLVMVEAMACGTPVVALDRGAVAEVLEHGLTGFVCRDVAEMASMIRRTDRIDPADCRQRATDVFDVDVMVRAYERAYADVVRVGRKTRPSVRR